MTFREIVDTLEYCVWNFGPSAGGEQVPILAIALLGTGLFLTLRLGFLQFRRLAHGFAVTSGRYDDPAEPGDVSHFQALTTALSATVGIGNIAGVAIAIHLGGPGALFWMWMTALLGMVTKYSEVTLAQHYRVVETGEGDGRYGTVSGGPMYYIERGLGKRWKPLAVFFACALLVTSFFTGNGIQANTVADLMHTEFAMPTWITGLITASVVFLVIVGGITRIGAVTSVLAPVMAAIYVAGALLVLALNLDQIPGTFTLIFREAFTPTAGVAGTGAGVFITTMMWGIRRGLFSNEAGQGSAPIAHSAAKTDEPVSEGVVALLEPFIDTILICSMTGLVILVTGVWDDRIPTRIDLASGDVTYVTLKADGNPVTVAAPAEIRVQAGRPVYRDDSVRLAWHEVPVPEFFIDSDQQQTFSGVILPARFLARAPDGTEYSGLHGMAVENGAPLTALAFQKGLAPLGPWGQYIVIFSVLLFAISTAISWSYYGDRCANYLLGPKAILPYKIVFVVMHFLGAIFALSTVWRLGDIALGTVTFPNLLAILLLSGVVVQLSRSYFGRKAWLSQPGQQASE